MKKEDNPAVYAQQLHQEAARGLTHSTAMLPSLSSESAIRSLTQQTTLTNSTLG